MLRLRGGGSWSSWFKGLLSKLGLFSKTGKLLVLGLDNAGKSTLLTLLVKNEVVPHAPTHHPVADALYLPYISPIPRIYLECISPIDAR